ncbi:MAG TPA: APC family permease [Candidatus Angelobacter sp.]|nr:APC family permease [Candidatus Angelobacter sp.]
MIAETESPKSQLRRTMGFWDVLLFNIATVLGPRWIAAAAHSGTSSISLWILAATLFFLPTALIIVELSTRFPSEGGLYVWSKEAFGDFHGFVAGWSYWTYTVFYFPSLLTASVAMSVFIGGPKYAWLAGNRQYLLWASIAMLATAVIFNIVGLNIGKWLQNAGGIGTYAPLLMLLGLGLYLGIHRGSTTQFSWKSSFPAGHLNLDTLNFWSNIAFAFTGMELVCAMSEEVREPRKTFPRAIYASSVLIAAIYVMGTVALLVILPAVGVDVRNGVFQGISFGSAAVGITWFGIIAALLVTAGNAGGVGATVAGIARVPFVAGIDRYLPAAFGKIHPRWKTPYIAILVQAAISAAILIFSQIDTTVMEAYQLLVDAAIILYFLPFLYMYAAVIKLAYRPDRETNEHGVLVPGGKPGVWILGLMAFVITLGSMILAMIPPGDVTSKSVFELKLIGVTAGAIAIGLVLYAWQRMSLALQAAIAYGALGFILCVFWHWILKMPYFATGSSPLSRFLEGIASITCPATFLKLPAFLTPFANAVFWGLVASAISKKRGTRGQG